MVAKLEQNAAALTAAEASRLTHLLVVLPPLRERDTVAGVPFVDRLEAALERRRKKRDELAKSPVTMDLPHGALVAWVALDPAQSAFEQQTLIRKALQALLAEKP